MPQWRPVCDLSALLTKKKRKGKKKETCSSFLSEQAVQRWWSNGNCSSCDSQQQTSFEVIGRHNSYWHYPSHAVLGSDLYVSHCSAQADSIYSIQRWVFLAADTFSINETSEKPQLCLQKRKKKSNLIFGIHTRLFNSRRQQRALFWCCVNTKTRSTPGLNRWQENTKTSEIDAMGWLWLIL